MRTGDPSTRCVMKTHSIAIDGDDGVSGDHPCPNASRNVETECCTHLVAITNIQVHNSQEKRIQLFW